MRGRRLLVTILLGLAVVLASAGPEPAKAQSAASAALAGQVRSQEEGPMEGVLVSVQREGSRIAVTVVSDAQGRYSFPRTRLEPGRYALRIRAVGYDLDDPGPVEVTAQKTVPLDLELHQTKDLASQLTNAEWILSVPGTEEQKKSLFGCVSCHTLERIVRSRHAAAEFVKVTRRMRTYGVDATPRTPRRPDAEVEQRLARSDPGEEEVSAAVNGGRTQAGGDPAYLSTINLSTASAWPYPLKTLPRPKGKATRVIVTEYELPRPDTVPHDVAVDSRGMVWYADSLFPYLGRLDPKTGAVEEFNAEIKPGSPANLSDMRIDWEGKVWLTMGQGSIGVFNPKTQKFQAWTLPKGKDGERVNISKLTAQHPGDGKVWGNDIARNGGKGIHRLDARSGEWQSFDLFRSIREDSPAASRWHRIYGVSADSNNNVYYMDFGSEYIGRLDAKTGKETLYRVPAFNSAPRRGHMDSQDRLWFGEYLAGRIGMFDTKTEQFREWQVPTPWSSPYDVIGDKNGEAWAGDMTTDRVARLNPKTGEVIEYLLPRTTNIRRVDVDNSANPVAFWVGSKNAASIVKVEPLE